MKKTTLLYFILNAFICHAIIHAQQTNTALDFDGIDDYINIPHDPSLNLINFTIEAWVKTTQNIPFARLVTKSVGGNQNYSLCVNNGKAHIRFDNGFDANVTESTNNINDGNWHHIAGVRNSATNRLEIYVDGSLSNVQVKSGNPLTGTEPINIGRYSSSFPTPLFHGQLDEVRIWNQALTQSDIQNRMNTPLEGNETGLIAYYPFQEGIGNGDNTAITTIVDNANMNNGTPNGFTQTGDSSNWVTEQSFLTNSVNSNTALDFDGVDDYIQYTNPASGTSKSVSLWVNTSLSTQTLVCSGLYISRFANDGKVYAFFDGSTGNGDNISNQSITAVNDGNWHYIVATNDSNTTRLYIDGMLEATYADVYSQFNPEEIGGNIFANQDWLNGQLDEYASWSKALTQDEIVTQMNQKLTGNESGLEVYYDFEEGIANGDNSATGGDITQVMDQAGSNNGTVNNFTRTGSSSNWVDGKAFCSGNTAMDFDGVNDYVNLGSTVATGIRTIEMWFKPNTNIDNSNTGFISLITRNDASQIDEYYLYFSSLSPNQGKLTFGRNSSSVAGAVAINSNNNSWNADTWYHVAGVFDPVFGLALYINGIKQNETNPNTGAPGARPEITALGRWGDLNIRHFNGVIDEVRIWNVARTESEIQCQSNTPLTGTETGLVAYYDFEEGVEFGNNTSLTNVFDKAGTNDGILNGFAKTGITSNWVNGTSRIGLANTWLGLTSDWNTASNWSYDLVPNNCHDVLIPDVSIQPLIGNTTTANAANLSLINNVQIDIEGVLKVTGNIDNEGLITFKSNIISTGQLDEFSGTYSGSGTVEVERFIPASDNMNATNLGRAFRFLTSTVTTSTSIKDNWQEGVNNVGLNFPTDNLNPNPGYGIHISGSITGANGFDATGSGNPSMFTFNNASTGTNAQDWVAIPGTDGSNALKAGRAYTVLIRGDRSINVTSNSATPTNTTLRARGNLQIGQVDYGTDIDNLATAPGHYSLVTNPYQAVVDYSEVTKTGLTDYIYVWDASFNIRGVYKTIDLNDQSMNTPFTANGNNFLAPGQAFFVQNNASGNGSLSFNEDDKATSQAQVTVFDTNTDFSIQSSLYKTANLQNGYGVSDGLVLKFNDNYTTIANYEDAEKFINPDEIYAILNNGLRSIDKQALPSIGHEIELFITAYRDPNYSLTFDIQNKPEGLGVFLNDDYLNIQTELTNDAVYNFSVDENIPGSVAENRFSLSFDNTTLGVNDNNFGVSFSLYPNPSQDGRFEIKSKGLNADDVSIKIHNILGQQVFSKKLVVGNNGRVMVNAMGLSAGVYVVELSQEGQSFTSKLIIE